MGVEEMLSYFPAVLAAGAAYGGVKAGLNGTRDTLAQNRANCIETRRKGGCTR